MSEQISALPLADRPAGGPPPEWVATQCWDTKIWSSADGTDWELGDMDTGHLWSVLGYLRWYAPQLREVSESNRQVRALDLRTWLSNLPMWRAISHELARRAELDDPDLALRRLEAGSVVPWQLDKKRAP